MSSLDGAAFVHIAFQPLVDRRHSTFHTLELPNTVLSPIIEAWRLHMPSVPDYSDIGLHIHENELRLLD